MLVYQRAITNSNSACCLFLNDLCIAFEMSGPPGPAEFIAGCWDLSQGDDFELRGLSGQTGSCGAKRYTDASENGVYPLDCHFKMENYD
jgi:hypothetical protein